jgi:hypothetical protein
VKARVVAEAQNLMLSCLWTHFHLKVWNLQVDWGVDFRETNEDPCPMAAKPLQDLEILQTVEEVVKVLVEIVAVAVDVFVPAIV